MTTHETKNDQQPLVFRKMKDIQREPKPEKSDEEIRAEMKDLVRRNAATLQILAKL